MKAEMTVIATGTRVITPLGPGLAVGEESHYGGNLVRHLVRLDDPSRWAFGSQTDVAAFFERELAAETCTRVLADGEPCGLVAPCPDCGRACHDVGIGA